MADKPSAKELAERLRQAEDIIETLRSFKVDAVVGANQVGMLRLKEVEDQLAEQAAIAANRMAEIESLNATLEERVAERTRVAEQRAARLREMAMEMGRVEERERQRLARLLHDGLQQLLVGAKYSAGVARGRLSDREDVREPFDQLERILDQSIEASRSLSYDLSPPILHDQGLNPALSWLAEQVHRRQGLIVIFCSEGAIPDMSQGLKVFLFHTVRELLLNIVKHADTDRAEVDLSVERRDICIEVQDCGRGFDVAKIDLDAPSGMGLKGFREKLDLMNGKMTIDSEPGRGTRVLLRVPSDIDSAETRGAEAPPEAPEDATPGAGKEKWPSSPARSGKIKVLVVDDHKIVRSGLVTLLNEKPDIEIVGEAGDGLEAIAAVRRDRPDVVVMDISMPKMNGIEATRRIHREFPDVRVLGLSMHQESEYGAQMKEAGATDLLSKGGPADLLFAAIRRARDMTEKEILGATAVQNTAFFPLISNGSAV